MERILVLLVGFWLVAAAQEEVEGGKCERIKLTLCQDLGYNWTAMPNLMGHRDQKEAEEAMSTFASVLSSGCSMHARFLLCSAFAPLCSEQVSGSVSACRALCDTVVRDCHEQLAALPPAVLVDCATFPLRPDRRLCMRPPNASEPAPEPDPEPEPRWPYERDALEPACPPGHVRAHTGECQPACGLGVRLAPGGGGERRASSDAWTTLLAWFALASTAFALLTFCAEPARYRYPERPAVWMAACHALVALAYVARSWGAVGGEGAVAGGSGVCAPPAQPAAGADALASPACVAFFSITYYFTLAADAWFANACVAWYLTAASEWSSEALSRAGAYLHAAAWGWAGAWTAAALALRRVAADEATGACGVAASAAAALTAVPRGAPLLAAAGVGAAAAYAVRRVRRALDAASARRVGRVAGRAALTAALYATLACSSTAVRVAEGGGGAPAGLAVRLGLCGGAAAGVWAWSRKSVLVWRRVLCPPRKSACCEPPLLRVPPPYHKRPLPVVSRV